MLSIGILSRSGNSLQEIFWEKFKFSKITRDIRVGLEIPFIPIIKAQLKISYTLQTNQLYSLHVNLSLNSGSSDGTLQIVDMRVGDYKKSQLLIKAH